MSTKPVFAILSSPSVLSVPGSSTNTSGISQSSKKSEMSSTTATSSSPSIGVVVTTSQKTASGRPRSSSSRSRDDLLHASILDNPYAPVSQSQAPNHSTNTIALPQTLLGVSITSVTPHSSLSSPEIIPESGQFTEENRKNDIENDISHSSSKSSSGFALKNILGAGLGSSKKKGTSLVTPESESSSPTEMKGNFSGAANITKSYPSSGRSQILSDFPNELSILNTHSKKSVNEKGLI